MNEEQLLRSRTLLNRYLYQQKAVIAAEELAEQQFPTTYTGYNNGLGRLENFSGSSYGKAITNGAIALGDSVRMRGDKYDSTPRVRTSTAAPTDQTLYKILTLLGVQLDEYEELFITGNAKKKKGFTTNGIGQETRFNKGYSYILNLGSSSKYLLTCRTNDHSTTSFYGDDPTLPQRKEFITIINSTRAPVQIESDIYSYNLIFLSNPGFYYLGNGIWQSIIESGLGEIISTTSYIDGAFIGGDRIVDLVGTPLNAVILPDNSNTIIHDGIKETRNGSISIESLAVSSSDIRFNLRNKSISHTTWTPEGDKAFSYTANRTDNGGGNYTYTEVMTGELLSLHFKDSYILQNFNFTKITQYISEVQSCTYSGTNNLTLKYTNGSLIELNTSSKFLVTDRIATYNPANLSEIVAVDPAIETFALKIRSVTVDIAYINSDFDPSVYVGEPIIMGKLLESQPYLIRGEIIDCTYQEFNSNELIITVEITSLSKVAALPFNTLFLDNGCFWNYYLSGYSENYIDYPYITWNGTEWFFNYYKTGIFHVVLCNDTIPFVHTNPVSAFTLQFPHHDRFQMAGVGAVLGTDNLIRSKIYRVCSTTSNTKRCVAEWDILDNGNIKFNRIFETNYKELPPYGDSLGYTTYFNGASYHP